MNGCITVNTIFETVCYFVYRLLYNATYYFSVCQIRFNYLVKFVKRVTPVAITNVVANIVTNVVTNVVEKKDVINNDAVLETVRHGKVTQSVSNDDVKKLLRYITTAGNELKMDNDTFLIYTPPSSNCRKNKVLFFNGDYVTYDEIDKKLVNYEQTSYSFLSIEIQFLKTTTGKSCEFKGMRLKTDTENYYVSGNTIDPRFVTYYARKYFNLHFDENSPVEYTINVVDGNADFFSVTQDKRIVFGKHGYKVSSYP